MKNIFVTILLLTVINLSFGQSKNSRRVTKAVAHKKEINEDKTRNNDNANYYVEVKISKRGSVSEIEFTTMNLDGIKGEKAQFIQEEMPNIKKKVSQKYGNVVFEFGQMGFELISHNFAFQKESEIHYYIFKY